MKLVYIAGPYRATTISGIFDNILAARKVAMEYFKKGYGFICPHTNSILMDGDNDANQWLEMDKEIIRQLKPTMVMIKGWKNSQGARGEHDLAKQLKLKIIYQK